MLSIIIDKVYAFYKTGLFPVIIALLVLLFFMAIAIIVRPDKKAQDFYNELNLRFTKTKKFDFNDIHIHLNKNGILARYPWMDSPVNYYAVKILCGVLLAVLGSLFHFLLIPLGFLLGYVLIELMIYLTNKSDNALMQNDIQLIYNLLLIQSEGVNPLYDSLTECSKLINPDDFRMVKALNELKVDLYGGKTFEGAIKNFNDKFNNSYIDSLCLTLIQSAQTGLATDLLRDINIQVQHFTNLQLEQKKEAMDIKVTIAAMAFLFAVLALGLSASLENIIQSLSSSGLF